MTTAQSPEARAELQALRVAVAELGSLKADARVYVKCEDVFVRTSKAFAVKATQDSLARGGRQ